MSNKIRIYTAIVDVKNLTLYKEDGSTITIPQGDSRLRPLLDEIIPQMSANRDEKGRAYADVNLDSTIKSNSYASFEKESSGLVKLFRIAKTKLKSLMRIPEEPVQPMAVGVPPPSDAMITESIEVAENVLGQVAGYVKTKSAVDEIMAHAVPVGHADFHEVNVANQGNVVEDHGFTANGANTVEHENATDTIIAVVDNKVIPGMERIKSQFARAAKMGSTVGVENFLKRLAAVIDDRSHTVDELLMFMERGDLPICDDGTILAYKVLKHKGDPTDGRFVDCHTGKVEQFTGAYVCMDEGLIDPNRRNECSTGLHVARRGYVSGFSGTACTLIKVAPEDVIAVPPYEANKMRVKGYHILFDLSKAQFQLLKNNQPLTQDKEGANLLAWALAGRHIGITHEVRISGPKGEGVTITPVINKDSVVTAIPEPEVQVELQPVEALGNSEKETVDTPVIAETVIEKVALSRKDEAKRLYELYEAGALTLDELVGFKKRTKTSWEKLGIPDPTPNPRTVANKEFVKLTKVTPKKPVNKTVQKLLDRGVHAVIPIDDAVKIIESDGTYRQRIAKLLALRPLSVGIVKAVLELKKQSKKSWTALGVSDEMAIAVTEWKDKE